MYVQSLGDGTILAVLVATLAIGRGVDLDLL